MTWRRRRIEALADPVLVTDGLAQKWVQNLEEPNYHTGRTCALSIAATVGSSWYPGTQPTRSATRCRWCKQLTVADRCDHCGGPQ